MLVEFESVASDKNAQGVPIESTETVRRLADLRECFIDRTAYEAALAEGNPIIYTVTSFAPGHGAGDLHYGFGSLTPGMIGEEYYMTKGHLHEWREAAEVYIGLNGEGVMLLEEESSGTSRLQHLRAGQTIYVPGHTAHRTFNIGDVPLTYVGVYPARAGHDYHTIAHRNFRCTVVKRDGNATMISRENQKR
jgi:glucose-6-phosphate isomerase, archaeal